jgi:predicted DNA-binding protein
MLSLISCTSQSGLIKCASSPKEKSHPFNSGKLTRISSHLGVKIDRVAMGKQLKRFYVINLEIDLRETLRRFSFSGFFSVAFFIIMCYKVLNINIMHKRGVNMLSTLHQDKVRINIQLPPAIKERLVQASSRQGKKVSALVRESIEEKLDHLDQQIFAEQMKAAYQDLAEENISVCEDFKYSDAENLPKVSL